MSAVFRVTAMYEGGTPEGHITECLKSWTVTLMEGPGEGYAKQWLTEQEGGSNSE